jgi:hypothetical protein
VYHKQAILTLRPRDGTIPSPVRGSSVLGLRGWLFRSSNPVSRPKFGGGRKFLPSPTSIA